MVNLSVSELAGAMGQLDQGGANLAGETEELEYGTFGWFMDPEGNQVELWEPRSA